MSTGTLGSCPRTDEVRRAIRGDLDGELLEHLDECSACQAVLEEDLARDGVLERLRVVRRSGTTATHDVAPIDLPHLPRYRVLREIGRGGQGTVYEAIQESTSRSVAIKVLRSRIWDDARLRERIEREVAILGKLDHANVCPVIDFVREGDRAGVVMPFLEGDPLARRLHVAAEKYRRSGNAHEAWALVVDGHTSADAPTGRFARLGGLHGALQLMEDIVEAVEAVHRAGVIHRDLKPANVVICGAARPVVLDFGLALELSDSAPRLTQDGEMRGTPASMAPEQVSGRLSEIDVRTDVYALGVLLYELLAFEPPFAGTLSTVLQRVSTGSVRRVRQLNPAVPKELEAVCMKAMAHDRGRRYASAAEMGADLARVRRLEPTVAKPISTLSRFFLRVRRHPALAATATVAVLLGAGLIVTRVLWWQSVGLAQEAYDEYVGIVLGDLAPGEAETLERVLGAEFESLLERPDALLARLHENIARHRGGDSRAAAGPEGIELIAPRATVRREGLSFVVASAEPLLAGSLRVRDLVTDEIVERIALDEDARAFVLAASAGFEPVPGRRYEWSVRGRVGPDGPPLSASAVFRVPAADAPAPAAGSASRDSPIDYAHDLLRHGLAAEALEVLARLDDPLSSPADRARFDLARARAALLLGREEQALAWTRPWHASQPNPQTTE